MLDSLAHHLREQRIAGTLVIDGAPTDIGRLEAAVTVPRSCSSARNFNPQSGIDPLSCADVRAGGLAAVDIGAPFALSTLWMLAPVVRAFLRLGRAPVQPAYACARRPFSSLSAGTSRPSMRRTSVVRRISRTPRSMREPGRWQGPSRVRGLLVSSRDLGVLVGRSLRIFARSAPHARFDNRKAMTKAVSSASALGPGGATRLSRASDCQLKTGR